MYINFSDTVSADTKEVQDDILIDFDQDKKITGICFEHASENFNLDKIKYMLEVNIPFPEKKTA
jgi:uncharacterized protein YuzE